MTQTDSSPATPASPRSARAPRDHDGDAADPHVPSDALLTAAHQLEDQVQRLTAWKHQLARQMDLLRRDGIKILERQKALAAEKSTLAQLRITLETQREGLDARAQELETQANAAASAQSELAGVNAELSARREELARTQDELGRVAPQLAKAAEEWERVRAEMGQLAAELENSRSALEAAHQETNEKNTQAAALEERRSALSAAVADLENQRQHFTAALTDLENQRHALGTVVAELEQRRTALEQATAHADEQQALLATLKEQAARAQQDLAALHQQQGEVAAELAGLTTEKETLAGQLAEARTALEAARRDLTAITQQTDEARQQAEQSRLETAAASVQTESTLAGLAEERAALEAAQQALAQRQQTLDTQQAACDIRQAEIARQRAELEHREGALAQQESGWLSRDVSLREASEQLEIQRRELAQAQRQLEHERAAFLEQAREQQAREALADATGTEETVTAAREEELLATVEQFQTQIETLARSLEDSQSLLERQNGDALLAKNTLEYELVTLRQQLDAARARAAAAEQIILPLGTEVPEAAVAPIADEAVHKGGDEQAMALETLAWHRDRLLHRALMLRTQRRQAREARGAIGAQIQDLTRQREELRSKRDTLEQVKRFLERQEMVMARKLADHHALRTVAAVGIFLLMVLGASFAAIYTFVSPVYRAEAVVQTAPPAGGVQADAWLEQQAAFLRSPELTAAAWRILRAPDNHYAMHDVREEWVGSLVSHLSVTPDDAAHTLAIRYTGPAADGVSQVCNALASAYVNPNLRDTTDATRTVGQGSTLAAQATAPVKPVQDSRLKLSLATAASVIFLALLAVMVLRHMVSRQLRQIDAIAEGETVDDSPEPAAA
ncbi:MAG TPA: hypothetical protein VHQ47_09040 [Phycisphaerae bacterium]|nr:hypothetical protein [Phycisphaerae bacterium]HWB99563.1 hypothetical protein [Bryobacteraceae bacterium]